MEQVNTDEILTNIFRNKLQNMKNEEKTTEEKSVESSITILIMGLLKFFGLSTLIWIGWTCLSTVVNIPVPQYWQTIGIIAGVRAAEILLISSVIPKNK